MQRDGRDRARGTGFREEVRVPHETRISLSHTQTHQRDYRNRVGATGCRSEGARGFIKAQEFAHCCAIGFVSLVVYVQSV